MSCAEKKAELLDKLVPERAKEFAEIVGQSTPFTCDIDWPSFATWDSLNFLDNVCLFRVAMALRSCCPDPFEKGLVANGLTKLRVRNSTKPEEKLVTLDLSGKSLLIVGDYAKGLAGAVNDSDITKVIMEGLRLKYHRMIKQLKEVQIPARIAEANPVLGANIELVIDFPTFDTAESVEFLDNVGFLRLLMALRQACVDAPTTELVRAGLKKVIFHNVKSAAEIKLSFPANSGIMEEWQVFDRIASTGTGVRMISNDEIVELIEQVLGLRTNQKLLLLQNKQLPERTAELLEAFGAPLTYVVDYKSFTTETELNYVDNISCHRINMAFRCLDAATRTELKNWLKVVSLKNVKDVKAKHLEVDASRGELAITCAYELGLNGAFSDNEILRALKAAATAAHKKS